MTGPMWTHEGNNSDLYDLIAKDLDIPRSTAKLLCLKIAYNIPVDPKHIWPPGSAVLMGVEKELTANVEILVRDAMRSHGWVPNLSIQERWEAGWTARLHAFPTLKDQSTGQHTWGILLLLHEIFPNRTSQSLVKHILYHDVPEYALGDMPRTAKNFSPDLYSLYNCISDEIQVTLMGHEFELTDVEKAIFSYLDAFEFLVFCHREAKMGNTFMGTKYHQVCDALPVYANPLLQGNMTTKQEKERMLYVAESFSLFDRHPLEGFNVAG